MARTATKQASRAAPRAGAGAKSANKAGSATKRPASTAARAAKRPAKAAAGAAKHPVKTVARAATVKALKAIARKASDVAGEGLRTAADRAASASKDALGSGVGGRLPIQASIDVAVPLRFAADG